MYFLSLIQDKCWRYRLNVGYDTFLAYSFLLSGVIAPALLIDTLQVMAMRNMRQEITYSCVFTDL